MRTHRRLTWLVLRVTALITRVSAARPAAAQIEQRCFAQTGYCIEGRIRDFWVAGGGLMSFGYPIGPQQELMIEGRPVTAQWFERARLELHPENAAPFDVLLGRLGDERLQQQGRDWTTFPRSSPQPGCRYVAQTGHNICGAILQAWRRRGVSIYGLPGIDPRESIGLFGLPLSDVQTEALSDGRSYQVQWFERARLELHPENPAPASVLGGLLGREVHDAQAPLPPAVAEPAPSRMCTVVPRGERSTQRAGVQLSAATCRYRDRVGGSTTSADEDYLTLTAAVTNILFHRPDGAPARIFANVDSFRLVDGQGRDDAPDPVTDHVGDRFVSGQVRPGERRVGTLVFRIPIGAAPSRLVFDGSAIDRAYPKIRLGLRWPGC